MLMELQYSRNNCGRDIRTKNASLTGATCLHGLPSFSEYLPYVFSYYLNHFNWWVPKCFHSLQMEMLSHPFNGNHNCVLLISVAARKGADWKTGFCSTPIRNSFLWCFMPGPVMRASKDRVGELSKEICRGKISVCSSQANPNHPGWEHSGMWQCLQALTRQWKFSRQCCHKIP